MSFFYPSGLRRIVRVPGIDGASVAHGHIYRDLVHRFVGKRRRDLGPLASRIPNEQPDSGLAHGEIVAHGV